MVGYNYNSAASKWKKNVNSGIINASSQVVRGETPNQKRNRFYKNLQANFSKASNIAKTNMNVTRSNRSGNQGENIMNLYKKRSEVKKNETPNNVAAREARSKAARNVAWKEYRKRTGNNKEYTTIDQLISSTPGLQKCMALQKLRGQHGPSFVKTRKNRKNRR